MYSRNKPKRISRKLLFIYVLVLVGLVAGGGLIYTKRRALTTDTVITDAKPETTSKIDLSPPTQEEVNETAAYKDSLENQSQTPVIDSTGKIQVTPVITNANQNEARGFVPGIVEEGGTCIASFNRGSFSFTRQSTGFGNVSTTSCEPISLTRADFATAGEWTITLSYTSTKAAGTSQPNTFVVN